MKLINKIKNTLSEKENLIAFFFLLISLIGCLITINTYGIGIHNFDEYDYLEDIYFASASIDAKAILNPNFYYTYRIPFGANIIMIPFVLLFGPSLLANKLGMIVFFIIYLLSIFSLAKALFKDFKSICYFVAISNMFVYTYCGDQFWHHIVYYNLAFVCLCGQLVCSINLINNKNKKINYIGLALWTWWGAANGISIMALSNVAIIISIAIYLFVKNKDIKKILHSDEIKVLFALIAFTIIGFISYSLAMIGTSDIGRLNHKFTLVDADTMISNILIQIFVSYLEIFYVFSDGISLFSAAGIGILVQILFGVLLIIGSIIITIKNQKKYSDSQKIVIVSSLVIALICIAQYVITQDSNERYIINMVQSLFVVLGINFVIILDKTDTNKIWRLLVLCFMIMLSYRSIHSYSVNNIELENRKEVIEVLKDNNLYSGFCKKPGVFYTVSNGDIKAAGISVTDHINAVTARSNIDEKYYNKPSAEKFFILLDDEQLNDVSSKNSTLLNSALDKIVCNDYNIYVFDISLWDSISNNTYTKD